jgi:hypothetical protein
VCCGFYEVKKKPSSSRHANGIYITLIVPHHRGIGGSSKREKKGVENKLF